MSDNVTIATQPTAATRATKSYATRATKATGWEWRPQPYTPPESTGLYMNYNDPNEINSMADVVLTTFRDDMDRPEWGGVLNDIPLLNMLPSTLDLMYRSTVKPIIEGDGKAAVINNLINLGETVDIPNQMVKKLIHGQDPFDALGMAEDGEGRANTDWDTGNWVMDMTLEVISDPLTWCTFGGSAAVKTGANVTADVLTRVATDASIEGAEKVAKTLAKKAAKAYKQGRYADVNTAVREIGKTMSRVNGKSDSVLSTMGKVLGRTPVDPDKAFELVKAINAQDTIFKTTKLMDIGKKIWTFEDNLSRMALKGYSYSSGLAPVWGLVKMAGKPALQYMQGRVYQALKPYYKTTEAGETLNLFEWGNLTKELDRIEREHDLAALSDPDLALPPNYKATIILQTVAQDCYEITKILKTAKPTVGALNEALQKYFGKTDTNLLGKYIQQLEEIDVYLEGGIKHYIENLKVLQEDYLSIVVDDNNAKHLQYLTNLEDGLQSLIKYTSDNLLDWNNRGKFVDDFDDEVRYAYGKAITQAKAAYNNVETWTMEGVLDDVLSPEKVTKFVDEAWAKVAEKRGLPKIEEVLIGLSKHTVEDPGFAEIIQAYAKVYADHTAAMNKIKTEMVNKILADADARFKGKPWGKRTGKGTHSVQDILTEMRKHTAKDPSFVEDVKLHAEMHADYLKTMGEINKEIAQTKAKYPTAKLFDSEQSVQVIPSFLESDHALIPSYGPSNTTYVHYKKGELPRGVMTEFDLGKQPLELVQRFKVIREKGHVVKTEKISVMKGREALLRPKALTVRVPAIEGVNIIDYHKELAKKVLNNTAEATKRNKLYDTEKVQAVGHIVGDFEHALNPMKVNSMGAIINLLTSISSTLAKQDKLPFEYVRFADVHKEIMPFLDADVSDLYQRYVDAVEQLPEIEEKVLKGKHMVTAKRKLSTAPIEEITEAYEALAEFIKPVVDGKTGTVTHYIEDAKGYRSALFDFQRTLNKSFSEEHLHYLREAGFKREAATFDVSNEGFSATLDEYLQSLDISELKTIIKKDGIGGALSRFMAGEDLRLNARDVEVIHTAFKSMIYNNNNYIRLNDFPRGVTKEAALQMVAYAETGLKKLAKVDKLNESATKLTETLFNETVLTKGIQSTVDAYLDGRLFGYNEADGTVLHKALTDRLDERNVWLSTGKLPKGVSREEVVKEVTRLTDAIKSIPKYRVDNYKPTPKSTVHIAAHESRGALIKLVDSAERLREASANLDTYAAYLEKTTTAEDFKMRTLKQEQTYNFVTLASMPSLHELTNTVMNKSDGLGRFIDNIIQGGPTPWINEDSIEILRTFQGVCEQVFNINMLVENINRADINPALRAGVLSSLSNMDNINPGAYSGSLDYFNKLLITNAESYARTNIMEVRLNIDDLIKRYDLKDKIRNNPATKGYNRHDGVYDIISLNEIIRADKKLTDRFNDPSVTYLTFDIETTALMAGHGKIMEIAFSDLADDATATVFAKKMENKGLDIPSSSGLTTFYEGKEDLMTIDEMYDDFFERRGKDTLTEREVLKSFVDAIREAGETPGKRVELIGHNSDTFDVGYIIYRMQANDMKYDDIALIKNITKHDTLQLTRADVGIPSFSPKEKQIMANLMKEYTTKADAFGTMQLFTAVPKTFRDTMEDVSQVMSSISKSPASSEAIRELCEHTKILLGTYANDYRLMMQNIKQTNEALSTVPYERMLDDNGMFRKDTPDHLKVKYYRDLMETEAGANIPKNLTDDELITKFNEDFHDKYFNYTSFLSIHQPKDRINMVSYKNPQDNPKVSQFFKMPHIDAPKRLMVALTSQAKSISRFRDRIVNEKLIEAMEDTINNTFQKLIGEGMHTVDSTGLKELMWVKYTNMDIKDLPTKYAIMQHLYSSLRRNGRLSSEILAYIPEDLQRVLDPTDNSISMFSRSEDVYIGNPYDAELTDMQLDADRYYKAEKNFMDNIADKVVDIGDLLDANNMGRARSQAIASTIRPSAKLWEYVRTCTANKADRIEFLKMVNRGTAVLAHEQLMQFVVNPLAMRDTLLKGLPWMQFKTANLSTDELADLMARKLEFEEMGIQFLEDGDELFFYIKANQTRKVTVDFDYELNREIYRYDGEELTDLHELDATALDDGADLVEMYGKARHGAAMMNPQSVGSLGDVLNIADMESLWTRLPKKLTDDMIPFQEFKKKADIHQSPIYNNHSLGSVAERKARLDSTGTDAIRIMVSGSQRTGLAATVRQQYMNMYYNNNFGINTGYFAENTQALVDYLQAHPEYVITALVKDKKNGAMVKRLKVTSAKQIDSIRHLNPVIMGYNTWSESTKAINANLMSESKLNFWRRIMYVYKIGYLADVGTIARNQIDSSMKTMMATDTNAAELSRVQLEATNLLISYHSDVKKVIKYARSQEISFGVAMDKMFDMGQMTLDRDMYKFVEGFMRDTASAGESKAMTEYLEEIAAKKAPKQTKTAVELAHKKVMDALGSALGVMQAQEQMVRFSHYLIMAREGFTTAQIHHSITKTHFDYTLKSDFERYVEMIIPFFTFATRNLEYWATLCEENPRYLSMLMDVMRPVNDLDSYENRYEYENNKSLQYQIASGALVLDKDTNLTAKLSPSFLDALTNVVDPKGSLESKIFQPLLNVIKGEGSLDDLPGGNLLLKYGATNDKYYERTGNPLNIILPGTFGATQRWTARPTYKPRHYISSSYKPRNSGGASTAGRRSYNYRPHYTKKSYVPSSWLSTSILPNGRTGRPGGLPSAFYKNREVKIYEKQYSRRTGANLFSFKMQTTNSYNLQHRINDIRYKR